MLKNRTILSVLAGLFLALVLWGLVLLVQKNKPKSTPVVPEYSRLANTITAEHAITPASIMSATQIDDKFMITGMGEAGAEVSLMSGTKTVMAKSKVSGEGKWALALKKPDLTDTLKLNIHMAAPDGREILSDQTLFILSHKIQNNELQNESDQGSAVNENGMYFILLTAPGANSRVLQNAFESLPNIDGFVLEAVDYDNSGGVIFSGTSAVPGIISLYVNESLLQESLIDSNGRWGLIFGNILPLGELMISAKLTPTNGDAPITLVLPFERMRPLFEVEASPKILVQHLEDRIQMGRVMRGGGYQYIVVYSSSALVQQ